MKNLFNLNWNLFFKRLFIIYAIICIIAALVDFYNKYTMGYITYGIRDYVVTIYISLACIIAPVIISNILQWLFKALTISKN